MLFRSFPVTIERAKEKLPQCTICGNKVSAKRFIYCIKCRGSKKPKRDYRILFPDCIDCGKHLSRKTALRCRLCDARTPERREISRLSRLGKPSPRYIKDRTKLKRYGQDNEIRRSSAYKDWSKSVKKRDGWKCQLSDESCAGRMEAHHIKSYKDNPSLRFDLMNGITLCSKHHPRKRHLETELEPVFVNILNIKYYGKYKRG